MMENVRSLIDKTILIPDESMENRDKGIRGTKIEVVLKNGDRCERTVLTPKGDPENPLTRDEVIDKLRVCADGLIDGSKIPNLINAIENIEGSEKFENPMAILGE